MKNTDLVFCFGALLWGIVLGIFYFGGLWWTVRSLPRTTRPRLQLGLSYVLRTSVALLGFWLILRKDLMAFFLTFVAFFLVRLVLTRRIGNAERENVENAN
jgi:F1F0 ATPase subunit 2